MPLPLTEEVKEELALQRDRTQTARVVPTTFDRAVAMMRKGYTVRRQSWPEGWSLGDHGGVVFNLNERCAWKSTLSDFEANDWVMA